MFRQVAHRAVEVCQVAQDQAEEDAPDHHDGHRMGKAVVGEVEDSDVLVVDSGEIDEKCQE